MPEWKTGNLLADKHRLMHMTFFQYLVTLLKMYLAINIKYRVTH